MSKFNRSVWLNTFLVALISYSGALKTLSFKIDPSEKDKVVVPVFNAGTPAVKGDLDTTYDALTKAFVEIATDEDIHKGWLISRKDAESTDIDIIEEASTQGIDLVMSGVELDVFSAMAGGSGLKYQFTDIIAGNTGLTYENIVRAKKLMTKNLCPLSDRFLMINADKQEELELIKDPQGRYIFIANEKATDEQLKRGEIGMIKGFTVIVTENSPKVTVLGAYDEATPANNTQDVALFYHSASCASAVDEDSMYIFTEESADKRGWKIVPQLLYGKGVLRDKWIVAVRDNT